VIVEVPVEERRHHLVLVGAQRHLLALEEQKHLVVPVWSSKVDLQGLVEEKGDPVTP